MKKKKSPELNLCPVEAIPRNVDFIHPWMPRDLQKLRQRVADALGMNYYDAEPLFTEGKP